MITGRDIRIHAFMPYSINITDFFFPFIQVPHPGYTGGLQDIDVNHHTVQFLIKSLPLLSKSFETLEVINVVRAQVQVGSNMLSYV